MKVEIINQLKDNYSFVLYNDTLKSCVIDPADSNPILNFALENNLTIEDIFITHHHKDHTSGVKGILNAFPEVNIHSPSAQIENTRFVLRDGDEVNSCLNTFRIIKTPGHTLDHIIYYDENNGVLFCGDTLFRLGCGRVFEGTLNEMFISLKKINELDNTIDPLTLTYWLLKKRNIKNICKGEKLVSEGQTLIKVVFFKKNIFEETITCDGEFQFIKGFDPSKYKKKNYRFTLNYNKNKRSNQLFEVFNLSFNSRIGIIKAIRL